MHLYTHVALPLTVMCICDNSSLACDSLFTLVVPIQEHDTAATTAAATAAGDAAAAVAATVAAGPVVAWVLQQLLHALPAADSSSANRSVQLLDTLCWLVTHTSSTTTDTTTAATTSTTGDSTVSTKSLAAELARRLLAHPCQDSSATAAATSAASGAAATTTSIIAAGDVMFVGLANAVVAALQAEPASKHQLGQLLLRALCTKLLFAATNNSSSSSDSSSATLAGDEPACRAVATRTAAFKLVQVRSAHVALIPAHPNSKMPRLEARVHSAAAR
jgi:hypothetical protein